MDVPEGQPPQTYPRQEGSQQPTRPPYFDEDPWSSSTPPKESSHWTRVRQLLSKSDGDTIGNWQEEINTQLIVSSLFSALTGAFVIETQKNLSEDPVVTTAVLLSHIAMQLNTSISLPPSTLQPFSNPPPNARAINSLLYASLGLSLSNVTLGLLCLQWLRELKSDTPGLNDSQYAFAHAMRHNGFQKWGANGLISTLPLLLLCSLTCFFAGLLIHVLDMDWVVSLPLSVVLCATFAILVLTTLLPAVVVAGCATFHRGVLAGGYPPLPPFHSLQSWICLQIAIAVLKIPISTCFVRRRTLLHELKNCPDWGRVSLHWLSRFAADGIFLPLIYSSSNSSAMEDVTMCLYGTQVIKGVPNGDPVRMKILALRYFIEQYAKELPSGTLLDLQTKLFVQLVYYFNDGGDFGAIGNLAIESAPEFGLRNSSTAVSNQILHAVVQSYEDKLPVILSFWDFFWLVFRLYISPSRHPSTSPMLTIRALNVAREYGRQHSNADMIWLYQYHHFVRRFCAFLSSYEPYTTTDHGKRLAASILFHPVWTELASCARAHPPGNPAFHQLWHNLDVLEGLKHRHVLYKYAPLSFDWTAELYPDSEARQSHISLDMDSESRLSVSVDDDESEIDPLPPSVPLRLPTDLVERDGEDAVEKQVVDATDVAIILNVEETDHRRISYSSRVPALVHAGIGDPGRALLQEEEESGSPPSVPPLPPMDVIESGGEGVVDQRHVEPSPDGHLPVRRVLNTGQLSSSVPTLVPGDARDESDVEQGHGQHALLEEKEG